MCSTCLRGLRMSHPRRRTGLSECSTSQSSSAKMTPPGGSTRPSLASQARQPGFALGSRAPLTARIMDEADRTHVSLVCRAGQLSPRTGCPGRSPQGAWRQCSQSGEAEQWGTLEPVPYWMSWPPARAKCGAAPARGIGVNTLAAGAASGLHQPAPLPLAQLPRAQAGPLADLASAIAHASPREAVADLSTPGARPQPIP